MSKEFKHNIIAIVYDFDGTLTPQPMQEYTVLPEIGIKVRKFTIKKDFANTQPLGSALQIVWGLYLETEPGQRLVLNIKTTPRTGLGAKHF